MVAEPKPAPVTCGCVAGVVAPAAVGNVTVNVPGALVAIFNGFGVNPIVAGGTAVIVTVAGLLFENPLFTISCTTYIPATSATNVGETVLAPESVAVLPGGRV